MQAQEQLPQGCPFPQEALFRDLQDQPLRVRPGLLQGLLQGFREAGVPDLEGGDVDAEGEVPEPPSLPGAKLLQGVAEDPGPQGLDQADLLRQGDELVGGDEAPRGLGPAQQRLQAREAPLPKLQDGLVVQEELVLLQGLPEAHLQVHASGEVPVQILGGEGVAVAPSGLGPVEGPVGLADQHVRLFPVLGEHRDAQAGGDVHRPFGAREGNLEGLQDPPGLPPRMAGALQVRQEHRETVLPGAGHRGLVPHGGGKALPRLHQNLVPHEVAQGAVEDLESVQVQEEQSQPTVLPGAGPQLHPKAILEEVAVRQPRELVVVGLVEDLGVLGLQLRQVAEHPHVAHRPGPLVLEGRHRQPLGVDLPVLPAVPDLPSPGPLPAEGIPEAPVEILVMALRPEEPRGLPHRLGGGVPRDGLEGRVHLFDDPPGVAHQDALPGQGDDSLGDSQGGGHAAGGGDVPKQAEHPVPVQGAAEPLLVHRLSRGLPGPLEEVPPPLVQDPLHRLPDGFGQLPGKDLLQGTILQGPLPGQGHLGPGAGRQELPPGVHHQHGVGKGPEDGFHLPGSGLQFLFHAPLGRHVLREALQKAGFPSFVPHQAAGEAHHHGGAVPAPHVHLELEQPVLLPHGLQHLLPIPGVPVEGPGVLPPGLHEGLHGLEAEQPGQGCVEPQEDALGGGTEDPHHRVFEQRQEIGRLDRTVGHEPHPLGGYEDPFAQL